MNTCKEVGFVVMKVILDNSNKGLPVKGTIWGSTQEEREPWE